MMVSFLLSFFPRGVLDEILNLIESVSEGFPSYSYYMLRLIGKGQGPVVQSIFSLTSSLRGQLVKCFATF